MGFLDDFVASLRLEITTHEKLSKERGFTRETIDALKLKSLGSYVEGLLPQFDKLDLRKAGIIDDAGKIDGQMVSDRVLIPYFNDAGEIVRIRPHKLGLKGQGAEVYKLIRKDTNVLICSEGEFKAAAAWQLGFSAIAVPGIWSFTKNNFDIFRDYLRTLAIEHLVFIFDQEVKDNPDFPNFKPDWRNRYDTIVCSYVMARKSLDAGLAPNVKICELPKEWMVKGKIDIDGALAAGKTRADFEDAISGAYSPDEYLKTLGSRVDKKHVQFISRRIYRSMSDKGAVRENFDCYEAKRREKVGKDWIETWVPISNFTLKVVGEHWDDETGSVARQVVISNNNYERRGPVSVQPKAVSSKRGFIEWLFSNGNFFFHGTDADLQNLWEYEYMNNNDFKTIRMFSYCGKIVGVDAWLFKNVCFYKDRVVLPDDAGVFWVEEDLGYKCRLAGDVRLPELNMEEGIDFGELLRSFIAMAGHNGRLLLGWAVYCLLNNYIGKDDIYPIPFLYGERASGKTTICKSVMALFGLYDFGSQLGDSSNVAVARILGAYSDIPVWFDEFSNTKNVLAKEQFLKSAYNKQPVIKGTKVMGEVRMSIIRAQLLLSGETIPTTDGVKSRSVLMHTKLLDEGKDGMRFVLERKNKLSWFTYYILKNRHEIAGGCKTHINNYQSNLQKGLDFKVDERELRHTSFFYGCAREVFGKDEVFAKWLTGAFLSDSNAIVKDDSIIGMFDDLAVFKANRRFGDSYYKVFNRDGLKVIALWFNGCHGFWSKEMHGKKEIHAKLSMLKTLMSREYFIKRDDLVKINGVPKRCLVFDYSKSPESLKELVDDQNFNLEVEL